MAELFYFYDMTYLSEFPLWFLNHPKNAVCTVDEIKEMESFYGVNFPEAYREYLACMGATSYYMESCVYLQGTAYDNYKFMKKNAKETLEYYNQEYNTKTVYEDSFIIFSMSDDSFIFMKNNEGKNPPIYVFGADGPGSEVEKIYNSFTEYLSYRSFFINRVNS